MNKLELVSFLKQARETATDETALIGTELYPEWTSHAEGKTNRYAAGDRVQYKGMLYRCITEHTVDDSAWTPADVPSLWAKVLIPDPAVIPDWEQPDSTNAYSKGDKVKHNNKTWESLTDNNVWEPGVTGTETLWEEVIV